MIEKRFTIKPQNDYWAVVDNYNIVCIINGIHTKIEAVWLCDFMNEQHSIIRRDEISIKTMMSNMKKLEEENEQLRQFINNGRRLSVKELIDNVNENELLKKKIKGLEKENEQLWKDKEQLKGKLRECGMRLDRFNCR